MYIKIYKFTCKLDYQPSWPCKLLQVHKAMGYKGLVFPHNVDFDKQIQFDNLDPEHIQAHTQWLYQVWELILAHTWTQKCHALNTHPLIKVILPNNYSYIRSRLKLMVKNLHVIYILDQNLLIILLMLKPANRVSSRIDWTGCSRSTRWRIARIWLFNTTSVLADKTWSAVWIYNTFYGNRNKSSYKNWRTCFFYTRCSDI